MKAVTTPLGSAMAAMAVALVCWTALTVSLPAETANRMAAPFETTAVLVVSHENQPLPFPSTASGSLPSVAEAPINTLVGSLNTIASPLPVDVEWSVDDDQLAEQQREMAEQQHQAVRTAQLKLRQRVDELQVKSQGITDRVVQLEIGLLDTDERLQTWTAALARLQDQQGEFASQLAGMSAELVKVQTENSRLKATAAATASTDLLTKLYQPLILTADQLEPLIQPLLTPERGLAVSAPAATGTRAALLVRDVPAVLQQVDQLILELDRPLPGMEFDLSVQDRDVHTGAASSLATPVPREQIQRDGASLIVREADLFPAPVTSNHSPDTPTGSPPATASSGTASPTTAASANAAPSTVPPSTAPSVPQPSVQRTLRITPRLAP